MDPFLEVSAVQKLADAVAEVAEVLALGGEPLEVAELVVGHSCDLVAASAAGMLVERAGEGLQLLAASSPLSSRLELFQLQADEGPCIEAVASGRALAVDSAAEIARRWPRFAQAAEQHGARAVLTVPLIVGERRIGALNLFRDREGAWAECDQTIVRALASLAAAAVLQSISTSRQDELATQLQAALTSRVIVEQAKGVLAERHQVHPDEAFARLRTGARSRRERLHDAAQRVVDELAERDQSVVMPG
ncbi:GAF and ANTAR domain-containing protein [Kineococcus gynurae]|uniref:GAF and ANTAR domain-containing protein n=1 Tax=Kineococcus gynurae TaxID=452979 RepID=A0ABV5LP01_9ACTN